MTTQYLLIIEMLTSSLGRPPNPTITILGENLIRSFPIDLNIPSTTSLVDGYLKYSKINHGGKLRTLKVAFYVTWLPKPFILLKLQ